MIKLNLWILSKSKMILYASLWIGAYCSLANNRKMVSKFASKSSRSFSSIFSIVIYSCSSSMTDRSSCNSQALSPLNPRRVTPHTQGVESALRTLWAPRVLAFLLSILVYCKPLYFLHWVSYLLLFLLLVFLIK